MSTRLVIRRVLTGVAMLITVSVLVFAATQALPGDIARTILGQNATAEQLARLRGELGLDLPVWQQYLHWVGGLLSGDLGTSLASGTPVAELLRVRVLNSATVVLIALVITLPLGLLLGLAAARRGPLDVGISAAVQTILSLPEFVVGIVLVVLFGGGLLRWLPPTSPLDPRQLAWNQPRLLILPIATMVLIALPHLVEATKTLLREELATDYVRWARLSGLGDVRLLTGYALPNVLGPVAQVAGVTVNYLLGGVVAVESVFAFPGIGSELVAAVGARDIVVVQVIAIGIATVLLITFLIADLIGLLTNPKLRRSR
ncbi:peptide/nickel transport system permease protein [Propionicimonas paludicola]|uniref:Peptide/nickel transport system permease protein n=1 Tax=Propionicimonas paludicola TaxID=185243 RepID=A0A2A9CU65_9ACTN|nr:ABC transporter permease [Propionicimonas paludicola]PFG17615.1 peptide/nickel transport system permease protein [Propionicimonas paludicola]